ncbi:MAG: Sel1 repeat protein [Alphaproteobacteria bacterium ADurb.Bin438]|nr:MAG: Sel1 repeat protein [Alphaproteobacteria bacterium ADurb.Bin438]
MRIIRNERIDENIKNNPKIDEENAEYPPEISDIINGILALEYENQIIEELISKIDYEINKGQIEFELGAIYLEKIEGEKDIETIRNLHKQAFEYFEKSAKKGYSKAYTMMCSNAINSNKFYSESIKYCEKGAEKGEWYSAKLLDEAYMLGQNVKIDKAESYKWRRIAIYLNRDKNPYEGTLEALYETSDKEEGRIRFVKWAKKHKELYQPFN